MAIATSFEGDILAVKDRLDKDRQSRLTLRSEQNRSRLTHSKLPASIDMMAPKNDPRVNAHTVKYSVR
jgi:hypothetical protein